MNEVLTNLHSHRYDWAIQAKNEFVNRFVRFDGQTITLQSEGIATSGEIELFSFLSLTSCSNRIEAKRIQECEKYRKETKLLEHLISEKKAFLHKELNFFHMNNREFSSKIEKYHQSLQKINAIVEELENTDTVAVVKNYLTYDIQQKKASILNQQTAQLQSSVEKMMEKQLEEIKEQAGDLIENGWDQLNVPKVAPIMKIKQKIDYYWLQRSYKKAYNSLFEHGVKWTAQMVQAYLEMVTIIKDDAIERLNQLTREADDLKRLSDEKINQLQAELLEIEEKLKSILAESVKVNEMWQQDFEHSKQLQGYFIKHWLLYKKELQQRLLSDIPEERWLASQYLQLLQQDGEKIIESMNI